MWLLDFTELYCLAWFALVDSPLHLVGLILLLFLLFLLFLFVGLWRLLFAFVERADELALFLTRSRSTIA